MTEREQLETLIKILEISHVDLDGRYPFDSLGLTEDECDEWWRWLETEIWPRHSREMVLRGLHDDYQQQTPKERILALFKDIASGNRMTYRQVIEEWGSLCNAN